MATNMNNNVESRCDGILQLVLNDSIKDPTVLNIDALLDALIALHDECSNAVSRGDKTVTEFLQYGNILFCCY
jgi:hypothetical protein